MIFLFNKDQQRVGIIPQKNIITAYRTENLYGPDTFEAEVQNNADLAGALYIGHRDTLNTDQYHLYKITDATWEGQNIIINGLELAYDELAAYGYIKDQRPSNQSAVTILDAILSGTPWTQQGSATTKTATTNFYYESRLSALQKLLEATGCEMRSFVTISGANITGKHITLVDRLGEDRGRRYVHGDRLLSVKREVKFDSIYTALVGRGKGEETEGGGYGRRITFDSITWSKDAGDPVDKPANQEFVELPEMTAIYGYPGGTPRVGIVEFDDITDPAELLRATYDQLVEMTTPKTTYQASVRDDSMTAIGDTVAIIRRDLGIEYKTRIFRREQNIMNPPEVKIELGTPIKNYTATKIQAINKKLNTVEQQVYQTNLHIVQLIKDAMADAYWGEDGYNYDLEVGNEYGLPAGLYSFDKPIDQDPAKFVYLGAGKIVISNEKNPDGTWLLTTLMDGDGLAAGTVGANQIRAGEVTSDKISMISGEPLQGAFENIQQLLSVYNDTITPYEKVDISILIEAVKADSSILTTQLDESSVESQSLRIAESNLLNFLEQILISDNYSTLDEEDFRLYFSKWKEAQEAASHAVQAVTVNRFTEAEAGLVNLRERLGDYEAQLKLSPGQISMYVDTGSGPQEAMRLTKDRLGFYSEGKEVAYFSDQMMYISDATVVNSFSIGNHKAEKQGNDLTIFRWIGG